MEYTNYQSRGAYVSCKSGKYYLSMTDFDHILTAPSSPPVTMPAPSGLHLAERHAPR